MTSTQQVKGDIVEVWAVNTGRSDGMQKFREIEGKGERMDSGREQSEQRFEWLKQTTELEGAGCRTRDSDGEGKNEEALPSGSSPLKEDLE